MQEQNDVSERTGKTILEMTRNAVIKENIPDYLWPEVTLAMVHVKNVRPTLALSGNISHHAMKNQQPFINPFRIFGSIVYVFTYEDEK